MSQPNGMRDDAERIVHRYLAKRVESIAGREVLSAVSDLVCNAEFGEMIREECKKKVLAWLSNEADYAIRQLVESRVRELGVRERVREEVESELAKASSDFAKKVQGITKKAKKRK